MRPELRELIEHIRGCFYLRGSGHWYKIRTNDGQWVDVDEDLNELLHELGEELDAADETPHT